MLYLIPLFPFVGFLLNTVLIARLGEIGRVVVLRRRLAQDGEDVSVSTLTATVVMEQLVLGITLAVLLVVVHFALPFFLLLMRGIKRNPGLVRKVAMLVIAARLLDLFWLVAPETEHEGGPISLAGALSWQTVLVPASLLALWVGLYMMQLRQRPLLPVNDPQFDEALGSVLAHGGAAGPLAIAVGTALVGEAFEGWRVVVDGTTVGSPTAYADPRSYAPRKFQAVA